MPKGRAEAARISSGEYEHAGSSVGDVRERFLFRIREDLPHALEELRTVDSEEAISTWCARWHFADGWLRDIVRQTIVDWRRTPSLAQHLQWADVVGKGELVPEPETIRWFPTIESEGLFRRRVEDYIADVQRWAAGRGLVKTPIKPNLDRDLAALVQFHVKGDDLAAVADEHFGDENKQDAARKALNSLASLIGLTLRK